MIPTVFLILTSSAFVAASLSGTHKQYYLQTRDGAYQYGYDTGASGGISHVQQGDPTNQVQGQYYYTAPDGTPVSLSYTAGVQGYIPAGGAVSGISHSSGYKKQDGYTNTPSSHTTNQVSDQQPSGDASYKFSIDTDDYKRNEQSDSRGNIQGQYSYTEKDGTLHGITYMAGEGIGFLVTSPTEGVDASSINSFNPQNNIDKSYSLTQKTQGKFISLDQRTNIKNVPIPSPSVTQHDNVNYVPIPSPSVTQHYKANYVPIPSPSVTPHNNVNYVPIPSPSVTQHNKANYVPIPSPSVTQHNKANYVPIPGPLSTQGTDIGIFPISEGSQITFVERSIPSLSESNEAIYVPSVTQQKKVNYVARPEVRLIPTGNIQLIPEQVFLIENLGTHLNREQTPQIQTWQYGFGKSLDNSLIQKSGPHADGSYSFSYQTSDHSRQESADNQNNVRGSYSVNQGGEARRVDYLAGPGTGFVVTSDNQGLQSHTYAPSYHYNKNSGFVPSDHALNQKGDASYSFSYQTGDASRVESADSNGNVQGSYSFIAKDNGQQHTVNYEAGAEKGFLAHGQHIPKALNHGNSDNSHGQSNNAAYSYSYKTDSSSKHETSDGQGNVRGSFEQLGADGVLRKVDYTSLGDEGFKIKQSDLGKSITKGSNTYGSSTNTNSNQFQTSKHTNERGGLELVLKGGKVNTYLPPEPKYGYEFRAS